MVEKTEPKKLSLLEEAYNIADSQRVPIILWEEKDENKEFCLEFLSKENDSVLNINLIVNKKPIAYQMQIKPKSLNTQLKKLGLVEGSIFLIKFMGTRSQEAGMDFKSFIVKKYIPESKKFVTSKSN